MVLRKLSYLPGSSWRGRKIVHDYTVDGSEIRRTTWDGAKTLGIMGYLPYQLVQEFFHQRYFPTVNQGVGRSQCITLCKHGAMEAYWALKFHS